jgi:homoserine O-acetyltransferase
MKAGYFASRRSQFVVMAVVPLAGTGFMFMLPETGKCQTSSDVISQSLENESEAMFENYRFRDGETLARVRIHYHTLGSPHHNASGDIYNAILILHWTGADGGALLSPAFRKALFAHDRPLDLERYYLIFPDNVGHGRSSKPSDGLKATFPKYGYGDMVDLQHKLVTETLGIKHLRAILGLSMGGMNAWQWAEVYPAMMDGIMPVVSLPFKVSGRNLLWRQIVIQDTHAAFSSQEQLTIVKSHQPRHSLRQFFAQRALASCRRPGQ